MKRLFYQRIKNTYNLKKFLFATVTPWQYNERKPVGYLTQNNGNLIILDGEGNIGYFKIDDFNKNNLKVNFHQKK